MPCAAGPHFPLSLFFLITAVEKLPERLLSPLLLHVIPSKLKGAGVALPILVCFVSAPPIRAPPPHRHLGRQHCHYPHSSEPPLNVLWHQSGDRDSPHSTSFSWITILRSPEPIGRLHRWKTSSHRRSSTASTPPKCFSEVLISSICPVGHPITAHAETTGVGAPSCPSRRRLPHYLACTTRGEYCLGALTWRWRHGPTQADLAGELGQLPGLMGQKWPSPIHGVFFFVNQLPD
jgi:hypothetical protein